MTANNSIRNVGILAHVDAGKTTLTEQLLYIGGTLRAPGRVDDGTTYTDSMEIERQRGISVMSQAAALVHKGVTVQIIDTPGHVDFSPEVEHALLAMDGAILVLSAAEGVQARSTILLKTLQAMRIPTLIFINKLDRMGASPERVLVQLSELGANALPLQRVIDAGSRCASIIDWHEDAALRHTLIDGLTLTNDELMLKVFDESVTDADIEAALTQATGAAAAIPVLFGAALHGIGVPEMLEAIVQLLPPPLGSSDAPLSAIVYKISRQKGRRVHVRIFDGTIDCRSCLDLPAGPARPLRLLRLETSGYVPVTCLRAGEIGILLGVAGTHPGDWLGTARSPVLSLARRALSVTVTPRSAADLNALREALLELADEDPALDYRYQPKTREFVLSIMGEIHQEVLSGILKERFGVDARFSPPSVIYQERPVGSGEGRIDLFHSPWYARAAFRVEPLPAGSGVVYESLVSTDWLYLRYQNEVRSAALETLKQGLHGWEVTDCKLTLIDGKCISVSMPSSCFAPVVPMAVMDALARAGTTLLEPMLTFELSAPSSCAGSILYDLQRMRAVTEPPVTISNTFTVRGIIPLAASMGYSIRLASLTGGTGLWLTQPHGCSPCPVELGQPRPRDGANPLDRSEYMIWLKMNHVTVGPMA